MSWVTNVVLSIDSDDRIGEVNRYFVAKAEDVNANISMDTPYPSFPLVSVDDPSLPRWWYGGSKHLEAILLIGAMNYFDLTEFVEHLRGIAWEYPEAVQLFVRQQEDFAFRLINVFPDAFAIAQKELTAHWAEGEVPDPHSAIRLEQETCYPPPQDGAVS